MAINNVNRSADHVWLDACYVVHVKYDYMTCAVMLIVIQDQWCKNDDGDCAVFDAGLDFWSWSFPLTLFYAIIVQIP